MHVNEAHGADSPLVRVTVELYGSARLASGKSTVSLAAPRQARRSDMARALALACPELLGVAIHEGGADLAESYTFNLNGNRFVEDQPIELAEGDTLLLFSSLAGG